MSPTTVRIDSVSALLSGYLSAGIEIDSVVPFVGFPRYSWASQVLVESILESAADSAVGAALRSFRVGRRGVVASLIEPVVDQLLAASLITPVNSPGAGPFWLVTPRGAEVGRQAMVGLSGEEASRFLDGTYHAQAIIFDWLKRFRTLGARRSSAET